MPATWVNEDKSSGGGIASYLLQEDGFYLLLEDTGRIVLDGGGPFATWTNETKS